MKINNFLIFHMKKKALFFLLAAFFVFPIATRAVNTETVGILPAHPDPNVMFSDAWFIYKLDLGQSKEDAVRVINNKSQTVVIKLYAVDATTTSDGAFALLPEDALRQDIGSWVKLAANEFELPPNTEKLVPFTVTIPKDADVGDHAGGIVMQEVEGAEKGKVLSGTGVKIVTRVGVRMYETVPGEVKKDFEISRFEWRTEPKITKSFIKDFLDINRKTMFIIGLKNKGNVKISPKAKVEVFNMLRQKTADVPEGEIGVIFPRGENKESFLVWDKAPFLGRYKAKLSVNFLEEGVGTGTKEVIIWAFPYRIFVILVFLFVFFILGRLIVQYFREAGKEKMPVYTVKAGETLGSLSSMFVVNWKKLARVNEIRKPFEVRAGQKLFIPTSRANIDLLVSSVEQGKLAPPMKERNEKARRKKKIIFIIIAGILVLGGIIFWYKYKNRPVISQNPQTQTGQNAPAAPEENQEKTASGAVKKSSLKLGIFTPSETDPVSSTRLLRKLRLIGYGAEIISDLAGRQYGETTIEYASGKKEQADMVKNDLGTSSNVGLQEIGGLGKDIVVYNLLKKEDLLELGATSDKASLRRDLVKVKVLEGGAGKEMAEKIKTLIYQGGFSPEDEIGGAQRSDNQKLAVVYSDDAQKDNAEDLTVFLQESGYQARSEKNTEGGSAEVLTLIVGK